ncbi:MAG: hypothetical protein WEC34_16385 [Acidimicrobiia bacterium]
MTSPEAPSGRAFWWALAIGGAVTAFGVGGLISTTSVANAIDVGTWVVGADLVHDLILAPMVMIISLALTRTLPLPWRAPVRSALVASVILMIVAYPAVRGFGHDTAPGNSSVQPLDYTTGLATALAVVWGIAGVWLVAMAVNRNRNR